MMTGLASFIIKKKSATLLKWPNIGKLLLNFFLAVLGGVSTGFMAGVLSNYLIDTKIFSPYQFIFYYSLYLSIPTLLIDIFPSLKQPPIIFQPYYPVTLTDKMKVSLITSFARNYCLFLMLSAVIPVIVSDFIIFWDMVISAFFILSTYLINRTFRVILYFSIPYSKILIPVCLSILFLSVLTFWRQDNFGILLFYLILYNIINFLLLIYVESKKTVKFDKSKERYIKGFMFRILANRNMKILVWLAVVFKILLLFFSGATYLKNGKSFFGFEAFNWLFASPVILFTYFGYNFFGINSNLFFTHALRINSLKMLYKDYSKVMLFILGIDAVIFCFYMLLTNQYSINFTLFYFTSLVLLFLTAFPISLEMPIVKEKFLSFDFSQYGSSIISFRATLTAIGIMGVILLGSFTRYYWILDLALIIVAIFFAKFYFLDLQKIIWNFYDKTRPLK